jgi:hypothetical protein
VSISITAKADVIHVHSIYTIKIVSARFQISATLLRPVEIERVHEIWKIRQKEDIETTILKTSTTLPDSISVVSSTASG